MVCAMGDAAAKTLPEGSHAANVVPVRLRIPTGFFDAASHKRRVLSSAQEMKLSWPGWRERHVTFCSWPSK
jgi:hypothetical protein